MWTDDDKKKLWDHKAKLNIDKLAEKNISTVQLEMKMMYFRKIIFEFDEYPR